MEKIEIEINKTNKDTNTLNDKLISLGLILVMNGFIYYYYYMKWIRKKNADEVVQELQKYPQDFINIIFFTLVNDIILYLIIF